MPMIPVFRPSLDPAAVWRELEPVITSGWLGQGPKVAELEKALADEVKAKHFITTSSCTAALHLAIHCLDLPAGAHVLTSPITFVSSNAAILWNGLTPVFGYVHPRSGCLLELPHMSSPTPYGCAGAVIVHLAGARCPTQAGFPIIEDCAHAFGAPWLTEQGPHMRCWSFHAVKNLPMGDGGGISTNDDSLAERLRRLRWLGISKSTHARSQAGYTTDYDIPELGWKAHMNDITAAVGLSALKRVHQQNMRRRQIAYAYWEAFPAARPAYKPCESACHFYPLFFEDRLGVQQRLTSRGIGFSRHYKPNFLYPAFHEFEAPGYPSAMEYYRRALVLPIFPDMTDWKVAAVIEAVRG